MMFSATFTALYDACVLYPAPLRDLLIELAASEVFKARWSEEIHDEWIRNLLKKKPDLNKKRIERTRQLMDKTVDSCLVCDYDPLIESLDLPDKDDRHVLAAAIKGRADVIVTYNLKHFPEKVLNCYDIEAQHPDDFIEHVINLYPDTAYFAVKKIRKRLRKPPQNVDDYLMNLAKQKLPKTIDFLAGRKELI